MLLSILGGLLLLSSIDHVNAEPKVISMDTKRMHSNTLHKRDAGAVSITDYFNIVYYVNATVGTPGQSITFVIDTAASDVWMPGPELSRQVDFGSCKFISV
jgi:predicted aspartyl protease